MIQATEEIIEKSPKVIDAILDEGKTLNHKFSQQVISDLLGNLKQFREALKKCEEDAANPSNSLFVLQNFTNLLQITYRTFQSLAATNFTDGMSAVQESFGRIRKEIKEPESKGYKPLKIDSFFN